MTSYSKAYAQWRGELYYAGTSDDVLVWIIKIDGETYASDEGFERSRDRHLRQVPIAELEAWYLDKMTALWRGQPFNVTLVENGKAYAGFAGGDYGWAKQNGLDGDQYNGYDGVLDFDELENVQVDRTDYLARWKEKQG